MHHHWFPYDMSRPAFPTRADVGIDPRQEEILFRSLSGRQARCSLLRRGNTENASAKSVSVDLYTDAFGASSSTTPLLSSSLLDLPAATEDFGECVEFLEEIALVLVEYQSVSIDEGKNVLTTSVSDVQEKMPTVIPEDVHRFRADALGQPK